MSFSTTPNPNPNSSRNSDYDRNEHSNTKDVPYNADSVFNISLPATDPYAKIYSQYAPGVHVDPHTGEVYQWWINRAGKGFGASSRHPYQPLGIPDLNLEYKFVNDDGTPTGLHGLRDDEDVDNPQKAMNLKKEKKNIKTKPDRNAPLQALMSAMSEFNANRVSAETSERIRKRIKDSDKRLRRVQAGQSLLKDSTIRKLTPRNGQTQNITGDALSVLSDQVSCIRNVCIYVYMFMRFV